MSKEKEDTVQFTFRIPVGLKAELERYATNEDRSLAKQIIWALRRYVDERAKDVAQQARSQGLSNDEYNPLSCQDSIRAKKPA